MPGALASEQPSCPVEGHEGRRLRRRGLRATKAGKQQRWECLDADGDSHVFTAAPDRHGRARHAVQRCPEPAHADGRLQSRGTRQAKTGTWSRLRCIRPDGSRHNFQVLVTPSSTALTTLHRPPPCPDHVGSKVIRHGSFGQGAQAKQRYHCTPGDGSKPHTFTPPLTRRTVEVGTEACNTCDELLSPHRGELTGARHTPWNLKTYAKALNDLSIGSSYAAVSLAMREQRGVAAAHLAAEHGIDVTLPEGSSGSSTSKEGRNAWHLAADLVEQYAPLLFTEAIGPVQQREARQRARNDEALAADPDASLAAPLTFLLDEMPVYIGRRNARGRYQLTGWSVLVVAEVRWKPSPDPMTLPTRQTRLRLVRAYPRGNEQAWRLVLDELGVRPDYIVADCGSAILKAIDQHYPAGTVGFVPSLFHVHRGVRDGLTKLPGLSQKVQGRDVLVPELAKYLDLLTRDELLSHSASDWATWWDDLIAATAALGAPVTKLVEQRKIFEPRVAAALPLLLRQPQLPASNAGVEARIRHLLEPFLENRKQMYRNLARTNLLCDLAVCQDQGLFGDLDRIARLIRDSNEAHGGWAPAPRRLDDAQPPELADGSRGTLYSSLLSPLLLPALADKRLGGAS